MAGGPSYTLLCILMLMTVREGVASSQFLSDFGLCIVDKDLNSTAPEIQFRFVSSPHQDLIFSTNPVVERGSAARYEKQHGEIEINDDGTYLFIIHRAGLATMAAPPPGPPPLLLEVNNATNDYVTIAEVVDTGEGSIFTAHVLAELKRGNNVFIHTQGSDVIGDGNQPFIFSVFLLYHNPIVSFPRARQSAFSVLGNANLSLADSIIDDLEPPTVNIGDGFDSQAGVFTAPFEGLYVFHLAVTFSPIAAGRGRAAVAFQVNGDTKAQVTDRVQDIVFRDYASYLVPPQNSAITVAQNLNQGDEITLRNIIAEQGLLGFVSVVGYLLS